MSEPTLWHLPMSPWSEKARWILDHHQIRYRSKEYLPMAGAPMMRLRLRKWGGPITVPVLIRQEGDPLSDSWDILCWAESAGSGAPLVPTRLKSEIGDWDARSQSTLRALRIRLLSRMSNNRETLKEALPPYTPSFARGVLVPAVRVVADYMDRKYARGADPDRVEAEVRAFLHSIRETVADGPFLYDAFSAADLMCATVLQFVRPVGEPHMPLGPATTEAATWPELIDDYEDLLQWRDTLYAQHR